MDFLLPFVLGFIVAAPGILLPGLLNITAAKINLQKGRQRAIIFALGASATIFVQSYIAVSFAKFLNKRPDVIYLLQEVGLGIFIVLSIFFFFIAKKPKPKTDEEVEKLRNKSRFGEFFLGMLLSALNVLPIPFYVFASIALFRQGYFQFDDTSFIFFFVIGAVISSFLVFNLYISFFKRFEHKAEFFLRNINYFLGGITGLVAVITLIKMMRS
ncbi:lysine transporter LysE [Flavobacterium suaedae]|uniref:Lysine transporter LysE n=1 Tax=Flavobacterium suaedae TaxID=1767027 RepID=A0ABQ1JLP2_9FLAO|nr:LysE family transporter [Flavobacterium suaedae]GGB69367.1 lysine transporter LysE [Flavobacterium suaedae]